MSQEALLDRGHLLEEILSGLLCPMPLSDALVDARAHQSRHEDVSGPHDWAATVGRVRVATVAPKPIAEAPYGVRMLVWWHDAWHIASVSEDCPGCPGESCDHCQGLSRDYWRDGDGNLHEGMDEDWPTHYLDLPPAPESAE